MRVQTDRYNWDVPIPLDLHYAVGLLAVACVFFAVAAYYSGASAAALSANPVRFLSAVVNAAARRGEGIFWLVWGLIGVAAVLTFASVIIFVGLAAFDT
jgi:hypothetical protein